MAMSRLIMGNTYLENLCRDVETAIHQKLQSPKDFESLRERIFARIHVLVSTTTLKRVWGYLHTDSTPSHSTLDTLAQFVGYSDYDTFCCQSHTDIVSSTPVLSRHLDVATDMAENESLVLSWAPNRICEVKYLGFLRFVVIRSENTRLKKGDTFQCSLVIEGEPLYLSGLLQGETRLPNYVCGKQGGVRFEKK
jgi:hypothetical protein